ncbi:MFS transporter [Alteromonas aestuariivivens]|uniref:MFS transporter n=1 Tax=Alteromonas aestuariivivens TaxID=1938339 RepID=A0A3D8M9U2_9ALTE|nr:MFS transporter [Alteromonas aestuariivivens]RDV26787.1 MFS transporter [Alteromonas aestuariivivens]
MIFRILFCALLATAIGQSVMLATLPSLGREAGISELQVAIIMSSSACVFALGTTVWSRFVRRLGHRRILMIGLTGYTIGTLVFASVWLAGLNLWLGGAGLFVALLVSRSLQSSVMSATPPSAIGYAVIVSGNNSRVGAISRVTSANNLGQIVGPSFAGALVGLGLLVPLYSVAALTILALLLVWRKLPDLPAGTSQGGPQASLSPIGHGKIAAEVWALVVVSASMFCAMAMMQQSLGFFMMDTLSLTPVDAARQVGWAMMVSAFSSLAVQMTVVQRTSFGARRLLLLALPLLALAYLLLFLHQGYLGLYVAMALLGMGMGMGYPSVAAMATAQSDAHLQARITGLITATPAMGYIIGPPLAAFVYAFSPRFPFIMAMVLMSISCMGILKRALSEKFSKNSLSK